MKKLAIGCLVVFVLGGLAAVGVVYYGYTKVRSTVSQFAELGQVHDLEQSVRIQTPFVVPTSGALTAEQVDKFIKVTSRVHDRLGKDIEVFQRTYKSLAAKKDATIVDAPALMSAYRDMAAGWLDAKHAQVDALNEVGLSLQEYRWIRSAAYGALDIPFIDVDFAHIADQVKNAAGQAASQAGSQPDAAVLVGGAFAGRGPASNAKLVEKYRKQLEDYMPLAAFGL
jgi:hypothetical protein